MNIGQSERVIFLHTHDKREREGKCLEEAYGNDRYIQYNFVNFHHNDKCRIMVCNGGISKKQILVIKQHR